MKWKWNWKWEWNEHENEMKWHDMKWNKMHACMNEWKNDWMADLKSMTWNECVGMKDLIWMTYLMIEWLND